MLLRKDDPWLKGLPIPDIRDWRVFDSNGTPIGFVETLVVDRAENAFEALLIGANDRFRADDVEIEDGVVRVTRPLQRAAPDTGDYGEGDAASDFDQSYRRHFDRTFAKGEYSFDDLLPAYHFGREKGSDADFAGRAFESAEEDLRAHYTHRALAPAYEAARKAVRCGYALVHEQQPYESGGLERESMQVLDASKRSPEQARAAAAAMSNADPAHS